MARCLIGCGSNLGRPRQHLADALDLLRTMPGVTLLAASRPRETRAVGGPPGQGTVLNGAVLVDTELSPDDVHGMLTAIENTLHRERTERWGPRTIDLDLLLYDNAAFDRDGLTVPHPRMTTRRFVLEPCVEIAPDFIHPLAGCTVRELLDNISRPHPHVAVIGVPGSGAPEVAAHVADTLLARLLHAPAAVPTPDDRPDYARRWEKSLAASAAAVSAETWPQDPHGTVADFWLDTFLVAAEERLPEADATFARIAGNAVTPNVGILLVASAAELEERLAFRQRRPAPQTDTFADLSATTTALTEVTPAGTAGTVRTLVSLQERLRRRLLSPRNDAPGRPKSVVVVEADDLGQAMGEAVAAVEAMV